MYGFIQLIKSIIKFIYPPQCCICKSYINSYFALCDNCISHLELISSPICYQCSNIISDSVVISHDSNFKNGTCLESENLFCNQCLNNPPYFNKLICGVSYNSIIAKLISNFKYYDRPELAKLLKDFLIYAYAEANINQVDLIIAMPVSFRRLLHRKYNQVFILAKYLSLYIGVPIAYKVLYKSRHTKFQASLDIDSRKKNIVNSFAIKPKFSHLIKDKNILLIDDIVTTGNTINEAAKVLKQHGAKLVYVIAIARVPGNFKI